MSTFTVVIKTDNSAYEDGYFYDEIIRNLKEVIQQVDTQELKGIVRDSNGNKVGKFFYDSSEL
jgi:predicted RNase H-like HicB family nuclease